VLWDSRSFNSIVDHHGEAMYRIESIKPIFQFYSRSSHGGIIIMIEGLSEHFQFYSRSSGDDYGRLQYDESALSIL